ncbi:tyrosine-type recombinase/integrase [Parasphingopyxis marina]|uniref:Site-specific integrase n=1 Tax=Parasphingopyxis marina TaxID=2761622 RepID=A0A842HXT0_9SPHN|nr:site-specific integrase [Parasphingopyxis marina]MBC2777129.1 site-specific integrase [Parasphingopyxis marina]
MATIRKRGDSWYVQIRRKGFTPRYKTFAKKSAALAWARSQEAMLDARYPCLNGQSLSKITLRDLLERYKNDVSSLKRSGASEQLRISKMQNAPLCDLALSAVTPAAIASYRDERLSEVKPGTVRRELTVLRHAFAVAAREWGIDTGTNPVSAIKRPEVRDQRTRRLREGELEKLREALHHTRNRHLGPVMEFALSTAMRRGEILSLLWADVDLSAGTAHIRHSKNGETRTVPLSKSAISILSTQPRTEDRIFPVSGEAIRSAWERLRTRANLNDFRFHDLRHEAISRLFEIGLNVPEVALISGHKDPKMLFRYTHPKPQNILLKMKRAGA